MTSPAIGTSRWPVATAATRPTPPDGQDPDDGRTWFTGGETVWPLITAMMSS